MRERVTFVHPLDAGADHGLPEVQETGLLGSQILTTREDKLTITLDELPASLSQTLQAFRHLHLRWAGPLAFDTLEPYASRLSPGLHLSYAPSNQDGTDIDHVCALLHAFGLSSCPSSEKGFTRLSSSQATDSPSLYYFQALEDLQEFVKTAITGFCSELDPVCKARVRSLLTVVSLDISYDAISKTLKLGALAPLREQLISAPASSQRRVEVGVFTTGEPPSLKPHHLGVSGVLAVLGEHKSPSPTLFSYPARHRLSEMSFSSKFLSPTGLHPILQLTLNGNQSPVEDADCRPYVYLTLPKTIFADRYQLADDLFLASKNLTASRYISSPVDLEAPAYTTEIWGSTVLLEMALPAAAKDDAAWTAEIPLHLRYLEPSASGYIDIDVPYPAVFWACPTSDGVDFSKNPFDRLHLGYDNHFDAETVYWHVRPRPEDGSRLMNSVRVPVLKEDAASWIRMGTPVVIVLGFIWVLWKVLSVYMRTGYGRAPAKTSEDKKKR